MGKTTIDFDDYEGQQYDEYQGDDPRPGWYTFELQKVGYTDDTEESLRWIFVIADGAYQGWPGFVFANFDSTKWKNQETLRAVQGGAEKAVSLDWGNDKATAAFVKKAKRVRGKVESYTNPETGDTRLSLRKVRPLLEDASTRKAGPATEVDDLEATEADEEGGDGDYTEEELGEMKLPALKAILKDEFDFSAADLRKLKTADAAIDAILDAQEAEAEGDADEADDDTDGDGGDEDFDDDFDEDATDDEDTEPEPEPEPEPAPRRRRGAAATKAAPAKAAPAKKAAAPAQRRRRRA